MDKPFKFILPSPSFDKKPKCGSKGTPHFLTPSGMTLLPREKQPPPMYGKRGATVPGRYLRPVAIKDHVPEPIKQYCEPCEIELQSLEDYKRHRAQHEECPVEGCQYKGHPTVMDKHITSLHSSGLFEKFKKLCSPEEIATWREERRKRFPTVANVLLKEKAQQQRQKRGERLEATRNRFGKMEDRKRAQSNVEDAKTNLDNGADIMRSNSRNQRNKNRNRKQRNGKQDRNKEKLTKDLSVKVTKAQPKEIEDVSGHGLTAFRGTLQMKSYKHLDSKSNTKTQHVLFGLVGMYGSDDESEDEMDVKETETEINYQAIVIEDDVEIPQKDVTINGEPQNVSWEATNNEIIFVDGDCKGLITDREQLGDYPTQLPTKDGEVVEFPIANSTENNPSGQPTETPRRSKSKNTFDASLTSKPPCMQIVNGNSSDEAPEEKPIQRIIPEYQLNQEKSKTNTTPESTNAMEQKQKLAAKQPRENSKVKQIAKRKSGLDYRKLKIRKQNTMLEKLLESDIRHERNVLLQCVRYVCENNFFGVTSKSSVG